VFRFNIIRIEDKSIIVTSAICVVGSVFASGFEIVPAAKASLSPSRPSLRVIRPNVIEACHGLREVNPDTSIVYQNILHLEVCLFSLLPFIELDKCILERFTSTFLPNDLATHDGPKAREYELQIFISGDGIEFADEQDILWRTDVCEREVSDHFESESRSGSFLLPPQFFSFFFRKLIQRIFIFSNSHNTVNEIGGLYRRVFRHNKIGWVLKGIVKYHNMMNPNIFQRSTFLIGKYFIELIQSVQTLHDVSENGMFPIQIFDIIR